jgi:carbon storage regulator
MLVLSRKKGERIVLPDCGVTLTVLAIAGNQVRLGVSAPPEVAIHREEVWQNIARPAGAPLGRLPG